MRRQPEGLAAVALQRAAAVKQVIALIPGRVGLDPELGRQRLEPVLGRPDPLAADLDHRPVLEAMVEGPPADPVLRLEHDHDRPRAGQLARGRQAGEAGADDRDIESSRSSVPVDVLDRRPDGAGSGGWRPGASR